MNVEFERVDGGLRIHDHIESVTYEIGLDAASVEPADTDAFRVPLTRAVDVTTDELVFPTLSGIFVHEGDRVTLDVTPGERDDRGPGTYEIDVSAVRLKLYVRVEDAPLSVDSTGDRTVVDFGGPTTVRIGVRSLHEHPAGTVTITDTPRDLMRAVSTFGSAMKTTSPERSFPTMRGHPPTIECGDSFDAPADLAPPDTDVRIEVPERYEDVYAVSTLAYYLCATVVPGSSPRVVAGGRSFAFPYDDVSRSANALLRHCFTLDCVVRTEGLYPVDLAERDTVTERADLDLAALYERPLAARTAAYLDVPLAVTDGVFAWHLTADVEPSIDRAELLPYLVNDLPFVRSPAPDADALRRRRIRRPSRSSFEAPTSTRSSAPRAPTTWTTPARSTRITRPAGASSRPSTRRRWGTRGSARTIPAAPRSRPSNRTAAGSIGRSRRTPSSTSPSSATTRRCARRPRTSTASAT
ncbi:hypothetical protein [Halarchaeum acidiphilum]|uniref:hypothetical protein n=1 Tax=Halarchaeum acidiphilum TaxID=489138 RepID=UPI0006777E86|nr:hypothetical protein [Halarchaeum acidiphilum]